MARIEPIDESDMLEKILNIYGDYFENQGVHYSRTLMGNLLGLLVTSLRRNQISDDDSYEFIDQVVGIARESVELNSNPELN